MEKTKTLTTYTLEFERFLHSGLEALHALSRLSWMFLEGLWPLLKELFRLLLGHCVVVYRHSPTKFEYVNPAEKRLERNYDKSPPRFFN
ncbi:MAG: hypothetical protein A2X86_16135 [Bdellovibrionales bacterium GWA2_49_15]|nr:MAG: hypothetical protein A2X86_16135 [Bdellovibrionales bacterium GWA2_49_15]HAZ13214.1 hypothetical protein [Bdellovibrionales bacterium]